MVKAVEVNSLIQNPKVIAKDLDKRLIDKLGDTVLVYHLFRLSRQEDCDKSQLKLWEIHPYDLKRIISVIGVIARIFGQSVKIQWKKEIGLHNEDIINTVKFYGDRDKILVASKLIMYIDIHLRLYYEYQCRRKSYTNRKFRKRARDLGLDINGFNLTDSRVYARLKCQELIAKVNDKLLDIIIRKNIAP